MAGWSRLWLILRGGPGRFPPSYTQEGTECRDLPLVPTTEKSPPPVLFLESQDPVLGQRARGLTGQRQHPHEASWDLALVGGKGLVPGVGWGPFLAEGFLTSEKGVRLNLVLVPAAGKLCSQTQPFGGTAEVTPGGEQWGTFWLSVEYSAAVKQHGECLGAMWGNAFYVVLS